MTTDAELSELINIKNALDQSTIVAMTDAKGIITYVNNQFCEISQYSKEELIGKTHKVISSGHHSKEFWDNMWKCISSGKVWANDIKNRAKDGSYYWVDTTIVPFLDENKKPYEYIAIRKDITDKILAKEQVEAERAKTIYAEKMASLGEMSAGIAHELGNPLGAIRGRMELLNIELESGDLPMDKIRTTSNKVIDLCDRMSKIIRGLTSYARDGSKDPYLETPINQLILDIIEFSTEKFRKLGIEVTHEGLDKTTQVQCREAEIGQVVVNLISNSCDAVKNLSERKIHVKSEERKDSVLVQVCDSGPGVPPDIEEKIFSAFYTTKPVGQGTGLGLSISKAIIDSHHGQLYIDRSKDQSCFCIQLPNKQP